VKSQCCPLLKSRIPHGFSPISLLTLPVSGSFYPHSPHFGEWLTSQASALEYDSARRERVSAVRRRAEQIVGSLRHQLSLTFDRLRREPRH